jgi:hypothetical protein
MTIHQKRKKLARAMQEIGESYINKKITWKEYIDIVAMWLPEMKSLKSEETLGQSLMDPRIKALSHFNQSNDSKGPSFLVSGIVDKSINIFSHGSPEDLNGLLVGAAAADDNVRKLLILVMSEVWVDVLSTYGQEALNEFNAFMFRYPIKN